MEETVPEKWTGSDFGKYKDGKAHGPYLYWWENGKKAQQKNNRSFRRAHGDWTSWHENGQKQLQQTVRFGKNRGCRIPLV